MDKEFIKADSGNLPQIDAITISIFFKDNPDFCSAELRNVKTVFAGRESYGDDAVGYVQLRRESDLCTLKCQVCPEHRVRQKSYTVTMVVNEVSRLIISCECHDCVASAGGCKHAVAFLMWTHRRSEKPASTATQCYWKKAPLARVGTTIKLITMDELCKKSIQRCASKPDLLSEFLQEAKKRKIENCELVKYQPNFQYTDGKQFSFHLFMVGLNNDQKKDASKVLQLMREKLSQVVINRIEASTREQSQCSQWNELRYGRMTASKAFEVSRCKTYDGTLVASIMGAKTPDTAAMKRGRILEIAVRKIVSRTLKKKIRTCGIYLCQQYPEISASPDGVCQEAVIEIKCPTSIKSKENYLKNGVIAQKCLAQIQLQMFISHSNKCFFCVADPDFENSKKVEIKEVTYDAAYVKDLVNNLSIFWEKNIFPLLYRST